MDRDSDRYVNTVAEQITTAKHLDNLVNFGQKTLPWLCEINWSSLLSDSF